MNPPIFVSIEHFQIMPIITFDSIESHEHDDARLDLDMTINTLVSACYYHIQTLQHICSSLLQQTAKILNCVIINSRQDNCNAVTNRKISTSYRKYRWCTEHTEGEKSRTQHLLSPNYIGYCSGETFKIRTLVVKIKNHLLLP